jgi:hypothetical protein
MRIRSTASDQAGAQTQKATWVLTRRSRQKQVHLSERVSSSWHAGSPPGTLNSVGNSGQSTKAPWPPARQDEEESVGRKGLGSLAAASRMAKMESSSRERDMANDYCERGGIQGARGGHAGIPEAWGTVDRRCESIAVAFCGNSSLVSICGKTGKGKEAFSMHASVTVTSSERVLSTMTVLKHGSGGVRACSRIHDDSMDIAAVSGVPRGRIRRQR